MTAYRYAATDVVTGRVLADSLPLSVSSFSRQLNNTGQLSGNLNLQAAASSNAPFLSALAVKRAMLWVIADGYPVWCGVVWDIPAMTLQGGQIPVNAQTPESIFDRRLITADITYQQVDLFAAFVDVAKYGLSKSSPYITSYSPTPAPSAAVVAAAKVPQIRFPSGAAAKCGVTWSANYTYSDLTQVSSVWQDMAASGNLEYTFEPGLDVNGNLVIWLRLGYTKLGRDVPDSGIKLVYPSDNVLDYGYQQTGSQGGNYVWATAPPNGAELTWISEYPHGADLAALAAGEPLVETSVNWQGSWVTEQAQVDAFADTEVTLLSQAMTVPTVKIGGGGWPALKDIVLGDSLDFAATSPLHPAGADGAPGLQQTLRVTGWTCYPPDNGQQEYIQLNLSASGV